MSEWDQLFLPTTPEYIGPDSLVRLNSFVK